MLVCLTFDDGLISHYDIAKPILLEAGLTGTFFICAGLTDTCPDACMSWTQIEEMSKIFEVGEHGERHASLPNVHRPNLQYLSKKLKQPIKSFCYPGFHYDIPLMQRLMRLGYEYARSGCERTMDFMSFQSGGSGQPYNVPFDNPFNIQCLGIFGQNYGFENFKSDLERIEEHECGVFCFHDISDASLPCGISSEHFERCIDYLVTKKCKVVEMRNIKNYVRFSMGREVLKD